MIAGRDEELTALDAALGRAGAGAPALTLVVGEPGIGKTALVAEAAGRAARRGWQVLLVQGIEAEAEAAVPFAALLALSRPLARHRSALPPAQRGALEAALGELPPGEHAGEEFLVGAALLSLLAAAAADRPVLVVADDMQWLDRDSTATLLFAARRLGHDPVALVATLRAGSAPPAGLGGFEELRLGGLAPQAAAEVLGQGFTPDVVRRLTGLTAGNPLALAECARALTTAERTGAAPLPDALPVPARLAEVYTAELRRLPPSAQALVLLAAVSRDQAAAPVTGALQAQGLDVQDALASAAGVLSVAGGSLTFRHPLLRAAALRDAGESEVRTAHAAMARTVTTPQARALHRAEATLGFDEDLAVELAAVAEHARARSGHAAASRAGERAARCTADPERSADWLSRAIEDAYLAGDTDRVQRLAAELLDATAGTSSQPVREAQARVLTCLGQLEQFSGTYRRAAELLEEAAGLATGRALLRTLTELSHVYYNSDQPQQQARVAERAAVAADDQDAEQVMLASYLQGAALGWAGRTEQAAPLLLRALDLLEHDPQLREDPRHMAVAFFAPQWLIAPGLLPPMEARAYIERRLETARRVGALGALTIGLTLAAAGFGWFGDHVRAYACAGEAVDLLAALGRRSEPGIAHEILAVECAGRGLHDDALALLHRAREIVAVSGIEGTPAHLAQVEAWCALCRGDLDEVVRVLEGQLEHRGGLDRDLASLDVPAVLVEAYVGLGRTADARALTERFEAAPSADQVPYTRAMLQRCRALTAEEPDTAAAAFEAALEQHAGDVDLLEGSRTRLLYGMWLRRCGRRVDAREELRAAERAFLAMDLTLWAGRAAHELAGTGERSRRTGSPSALTSQETRVALLAAEGRTNREIASALFLSPKTVEHHLGAVLRKRGLRSRTELARLVAQDDLGG